MEIKLGDLRRPGRDRPVDDGRADARRRPLRARRRRRPGSPVPAALLRHLDAARVRRRADGADPARPRRDQPPAAAAGDAGQGRGVARRAQRRAGRGRARRGRVLGRGRGDGRAAAHAEAVGRRARGGDRDPARLLGRRARRCGSRASTTASAARARARRRRTGSASGSAPTARACCASPAGSATAGSPASAAATSRPDDALRMQGVVDEAARAAGREPADDRARRERDGARRRSGHAGPTGSRGSRPSSASRRCSSPSRTTTRSGSCGASARTSRRACASCSAERGGGASRPLASRQRFSRSVSRMNRPRSIELTATMSSSR